MDGTISNGIPERGGKRGAKAELADRAVSYLESHYTDKFSLDAIASALYINKIYLAKCFRDETGITLLTCHHRLRCREAARLLKHTDLSIRTIGIRTGFTTSSHFARVFREVEGCSPTEYRRRLRSS